MHSVCRKVQGLPWQKEEPKGMQANLNHLVAVGARPNPKPTDPNALTLAYGAGCAPRLVQEISNTGSLVLRQKALKEVLKQMSKPKNLAELLAAGLVPALNAAASDADQDLRVSATLALSVAAQQLGGREQMLEHSSIAVLKEQTTEECQEVRMHCLLAMLHVSKDSDGANALIKAGAVKLLVERCAQETEQLQSLALMTLQQAMTQPDGLNLAIEVKALETISPLLSHEDLLIREKAALCLAAYTINLREKRAAVQAGTLKPLLVLLADESLQVRVAATSALMSITVANECKSSAMEAKAVRALVQLLDSAVAYELQDEDDSQFASQTVNLLQCLTNLAEHPHGRKQLQASLRQLKMLADSRDAQIRKHADIAVRIITWKP